MMKKVKLYTDGACKGNPGPGGWGAILMYGEHSLELSGYEAHTTNNRMELLAAIIGLEHLIRPCQVTLYSDSQYLVKAFTEGWLEGWIKKGWKRGKNDPVKNVDLWKRLLAAMEPHQVEFCWVKGHNGHPQNERCDELATTAADADDLTEDNMEL